MTSPHNRPGNDADTDNPLRNLVIDDGQLRRIFALLGLNKRKVSENKCDAA